MAPALQRRAYHSPSSLDTGMRCARRWWYTYREGRREPRVTFAQVEAAGKWGVADVVTELHARTWTAYHPSLPEVRQTGLAANVAAERVLNFIRRNRAAALGVAVHEVFEGHFRRESPDWHSTAGRIAQRGLPFLPTPDACRRGEVEHPIGDAPIRYPAGVEPEAHAPPVGLVVDRVTWAGWRDLVVLPTKEESARLGLATGWLLVDYKSKGSITGEYGAKSPAELRADFQANLYALGTCRELSLPRVQARWLYMETKSVNRAAPVDVWIDGEKALRRVERASVDARALDGMTCVSDAQQNAAACGDYGGCPHHKSVGGPCDATRLASALIPLRVVKKVDPTTMALNKKFADKFAEDQAEVEAEDAAPKKKAKGKAPPPPVKKAAPVEEEETEDEEEEEEEETAPPAKKTRAKKGSLAPFATTFPGAFGDLVISGDPRDVATTLSALAIVASAAKD